MNLLRWLRPRPKPRLLDLAAPDVAADPFPHYEKLRAAGPVHYLPANDLWLILGHDEVKSAFAQPEIFSNAPYAEIDNVLLAADPPAHDGARKIVSRRFTAKGLDDLVSFAEERAASLIAPELDAVADYATPLSSAVAARIVGFDDSALADVRDALAASMSEPEPLAALIASLDSMAPRASLFPELAAEMGDGDARSLIRLLWLAATTTTDRVIVRCIFSLVENPDLRERIAADRSLLPSFVDEVLRLHPPELMVPRLARQKVSLGGVDIPQGAFVRLCVACANRDPARFEAPAEIRLDRQFRRHFAFGSGIHHCIGAPLARRIIAAAVTPFLEPGRRLRAAEPLESIPYYLSPTACAPMRLRIAL